MSVVYLNGQFLPASEAQISPMDRGFLFGEGIYEVIPVIDGRMVGFKAHLQRLSTGLDALRIAPDISDDSWFALCDRLIRENETPYMAIYIQVTRGADTKRAHAYPEGLRSTCFAFTYATAQPLASDANNGGMSVITTEDLRWKRCHIKSTALLGNVMHHQEARDAGCQEVILYNEALRITEASSSNVFIVSGDRIKTPPLDHQILPGVTRNLLVQILNQKGDRLVEESNISLSELKQADEVWLTSSTKEVIPVLHIDGGAVGTGQIGPVWREAKQLFDQHKFDL